MGRQSEGIPLPDVRLRHVLLLALVAFVGWELWVAHKESQKKAALWDSNASPVDRVQAVEALVAEGRSAVPRLVQALQDPDPSVRQSAVLALFRLGPDARQARPQLIEALEDEDAHVRSMAVKALERMNHTAQRVSRDRIQPLIRLLNDPALNVREGSADALVAIGSQTVPSVTKAAGHKDATVRRLVAEILGRIQSGDEMTVNALRKLSQDDENRVRHQAYAGLLINKALNAADMLRALRDENENIVLMVLSGIPQVNLYSLGPSGASWRNPSLPVSRLGPGAERIIPELMGLLENEENSRLRSLSLKNLGAIGPAAQPAIPRIIEILENPDEKVPVRRQAMEALVRICTDRERVVPRLTRLLTEQGLSETAGRLLRELDPEAARAVVPELARRLENKAPQVRSRAAAALYGIGPESVQALPALIQALQEEDNDINFIVATMGEIGPRAKDAVPALIQLLSHPPKHFRKHDVQRRVIQTLGDMGPGAKAAVPKLVELCGSAAPGQVRVDAIRALSRIGVASDEVIASLLVAADDDYFAYVRCAAIQTLVELAPDRHDVLSHVKRALKDRRSGVRVTAAWALGRIQSDPKPVVAALIEALDDADPCVRTMAALSLAEWETKGRAALPALQQALINEANSPLHKNSMYCGGINSPAPEPIEELPYWSAHDAVTEAISIIEASAKRKNAGR